MANFPFLTSLCVALTPFTPSHLPLPQIAASSHPPLPPQPHLHTNKCRGLTRPSLGPWSDPGVIFFFFRRSGAEVTSEVRFGGRWRGGVGWGGLSGRRVVCTDLPHSHSLTGFELVDGSGRLHFPRWYHQVHLEVWTSHVEVVVGGWGVATQLYRCVSYSQKIQFRSTLLETEGFSFSLQEMDFVFVIIDQISFFTQEQFSDRKLSLVSCTH